tara:strand:- start:1458 stop:1634 length:177 start_codon:yes stop_codon:yes gene_type:complete
VEEVVVSGNQEQRKGNNMTLEKRMSPSVTLEKPMNHSSEGSTPTGEGVFLGRGLTPSA